MGADTQQPPQWSFAPVETPPAPASPPQRPPPPYPGYPPQPYYAYPPQPPPPPFNTQYAGPTPPPPPAPAADTTTCCACGPQLALFLLGFLFWPLWFVALLLPLCGVGAGPRERGPRIANAVAALVFSIAVVVAVALGVRYGQRRWMATYE